MSSVNDSTNANSCFPQTFVLRMEEDALTKKLHDEFVKMVNKDHYSFKLFHQFKNRQVTFKTWSKSHPISGDKLAQAGFCYLGFGDTCICAWCSTIVDHMSYFDEPFSKHRELAKNCCKFINYIFPPLPLIENYNRELQVPSSSSETIDESQSVSF